MMIDFSFIMLTNCALRLHPRDDDDDDDKSSLYVIPEIKLSTIYLST